MVGLQGYSGDFRDIEDLQSYWEQLEPVARIEVLRHVINEQCRLWRTPPPDFRVTAEAPLGGGRRIAEYYRAQREIIFYVRMGTTKENIPAIDRIDLALEVVLHETAHHIDWTFRMEERGLLLAKRKTSKAWRLARNAWYNMSDDEDKKNPDHPNIFETGTQWMNEYLYRDGDFLMKTMQWIDEDRSWYHPQLEEDFRNPDVQDFQDTDPPVELDSDRPGDPRIDEMDDIDPAILDLRHWLRNPDYWIESRAPVDLHRRYVRDIWDAAMRLADGYPARALAVAAEGVRPDRAPEESRRQHEERLSGLPSRAFGTYRGFTGINKLERFFRAAARSHIAGERQNSLAGWFGQAFDWVASLLQDDRNDADPGTLWADTLGASFGSALRWNPDERVGRFLKTVPAPDEALPIRLDERFEEGYIADIVVPAPEGLAKGYPVEIRAVDADGYAYTMNVSLDPDGRKITLDDAPGSTYRLSHDDPWYFSNVSEGRDDDARIVEDRRGIYVQPSSAYRAVNQQLRSHQEIQDRLIANLGDLQANQRWLEDQTQRRLTEEQMRRNEQQQRETQQRIEQTHAQLQRNAGMLDQLHQQRAIANDQMHESLTRQTRDQGLLQQIQEQHQHQQGQIERARRDQLDQEERQRHADERQRERERQAHEEQQRRDQQRRNDDFVFTTAPANDPTRVTIGGPGTNVFGDPHHPH